MAIAYTNGSIFTGHKMENQLALLVSDGQIDGFVPETEIPSQYHQRDLQGAILAPAFIDLQIYGGNGYLFSQQPNPASLAATYAYCLAGGAAHFMITMATNSLDRFVEGIAAVKAYWQQNGKGLLGLHLEGPYINPAKKGAHLEAYIKKPTPEEIRFLLETAQGAVKMMTLAPECCSSEIIDLLQEAGVLVSVGHSNASYQQAMQAFEKIPVATHLFNAMSPFLHRAPGLVGALLDHPRAMSSLVCDGIHVDFAAARIAKTCMKQRLFFITDAVTETLEGAYTHVFRGDHFSLPDGTLSGSSLTMLQSVRNGVEKMGLDLEEALRMASTYPASLLKDKKRGLLAPGYEADLVHFDKDWHLLGLVTA